MKKKRKKTSHRIRFRQSLFWDVDPKTIDPKRHARYIIERILEFGNDDEVRWMVHYYSPRLIRDVLYRSRGVLHEKTKALWSLIYPLSQQ
jgi:hypothetical protein